MSLGDSDVFEFTEHAAKARLARVIRNSEEGWLFYSPDGTAYHLLSDEAELLERRGLRKLKKCSWLTAELSKLPGRSFKLALAVLAINISFAVAFGRAYIEPIGDFMSYFVFPSLVLFALFFGLFRPLVALVIRSTIMLAWQAEIAARLRREGRGAVPSLIEKKHLGYNLFRIAFTMALGILTVRFASIWFMTPSQVAEVNFGIDIVLVGMLLVTFVPARMIDITHIRRKWLD